MLVGVEDVSVALTRCMGCLCRCCFVDVALPDTNRYMRFEKQYVIRY